MFRKTYEKTNEKKNHLFFFVIQNFFHLEKLIFRVLKISSTLY